MDKYPHIAHWLNVWSRELAVLKWSLTSDQDRHHSIFHLSAFTATEPLITFEETFISFKEQMLAGNDSSTVVTELMELSFRVNSKLNFTELLKETKELYKGLEKEFDGLGLVWLKEESPLVIFCLLHRIYAIEISARVKTYEPGKHNPMLGPYQPALEELLGLHTNPPKEEK
ncbi:hypothetical protein [Photobacterium phage PDCC-1]|uniref:Uncharacterized protein n=1 Tax=Photobacterium phage PDCC-1 TaxID=2664246 RepID=A0A6B9J3W4_9CAUD|nr:hypothetical protein HWC77_gp140 [Photobacterium phage PDCC-1]QGZ14503.1 hypothetical protein [Photobacterium phage PDCC-1]